MESFPQYENDGSERLSFSDIWRNINPQEVLGIDCFIPDVSLNNDENLITLKLTANEFTQMFSALYNGAEITYPDTFLQIIANFLKGVHCPPEFEDDVCQNYPPYASFIDYAPVNPFDDLYTVPDGYLLPPFGIVGKDGYAPDGYSDGDVLVAISSIPFLGGWDDIIGANLPTIQIIVNGAGKISLKLLAVPLGGMAIITIDNPPDIFDIIAGVLSGSESIVDLNRDDVSIPPETQLEIDIPVEVTGAGLHTVYVVFFPVIDDSIVPIRFGGGFRGLELCDFIDEVVDMGITDIRFSEDSLNIQAKIAGEWEDKIDVFEMIKFTYNPVVENRLNYDPDNRILSVGWLKEDGGWFEDGGTGFPADLYDYTTGAYSAAAAAQSDATDALSAAAAAQSDATDALAAAAAAQSDATDALAAAAAAQSDATDALAATDALIATVSDHELRILALEEAGVAGIPTWSKEWDFTASDGDWETGVAWSAGNGHPMSFTNFLLEYTLTAGVFDSRVTWVEIEFKHKTGLAAPTGTVNYPSDSTEVNHVDFPSSTDGTLLNWLHIGAQLSEQNPAMKINIPDALHEYYVSWLKIWGVGDSPF